MSYARRGPRVIATFFAVALATVTFSAVGAQAQSFVVELSLALAIGAGGTMTQESAGRLQVLDLNIYIECNLGGGGTWSLGSKTATWSAEFINCEVLDKNLKRNELCDVDAIKTGGEASAIGLDEVLLSPIFGLAFTTVLLLDSHVAEIEELECNLDEKNEVTGSLKALVLYEDPLHETKPNLHLEAEVLLLESPAVQGDTLKFGGHTSWLTEGKVYASLWGNHFGDCWGIE
jgi:hypothetical protein